MRQKYEEAAFTKQRIYVQRFHGVCFTKSGSLEQLDTQFFQLELLNLATCRFRISFYIEDVGGSFEIDVSVSQQVQQSNNYHVPR